MDQQLDLAPAGYLVMDEELKIVEMNKSMLEMTNIEFAPMHMHDLLTIASRVYFQTYFIPAIITHGTVSEMFLKLKSPEGQIPVLMNTNKRNGFYECVFMQVHVRSEYEIELLNAKREAERISQETAAANKHLTLLLEEVENKQTELNVLNERLKELTVTDPLTGLKNRRYLEEFLPGFSNRNGLAFLMIDIDFFKLVNDTFGHHAGDEVLKELAVLLSETIGDAGFAVRIGGEEFAVVLPQTDLAIAARIAEKTRQKVESHVWPYKSITVSIGIAWNAGGGSGSELLNRADEALYISKNKGRNRVTIAS